MYSQKNRYSLIVMFTGLSRSTPFMSMITAKLVRCKQWQVVWVALESTVLQPSLLQPSSSKSQKTQEAFPSE